MRSHCVSVRLQLVMGDRRKSGRIGPFLDLGMLNYCLLVATVHLTITLFVLINNGGLKKNSEMKRTQSLINNIITTLRACDKNYDIMHTVYQARWFDTTSNHSRKSPIKL